MKLWKIAVLGFCLILSGCAGLNTTMTASADVNPDINGNPSAIAMSIFELSSPDAFKKASFASLYINPQKALGATLLTEQNLMLAPGETTSIQMPVLANVHYLGYVAAYRNLYSARWQVLAPVANSVVAQKFSLKVNANGLELQP